MTAKYVHKFPVSAGDGRPTALQVLEDEDLEHKMAGNVILITEGSTGTGIGTARTIFVSSATLFLTARDLSEAKSEITDIITSDRVHLLELDLNSLESVRACANDLLLKSKTPDTFVGLSLEP